MLKFDVTKKCLVGEGWCPIFAKAQIQEALQHATFDSNSQVGIIYHVMDAVEPPPTYFRTNRFTNAFQEIVDAYGISFAFFELSQNEDVYFVWGDPDEHRNCIYLNAHFFGSSLDIRFQFVLQMIFLNRLFGYLLLLIIIKWCTGSQSDLYHRPLQLIQLLVSYCSSMDALSKTFYFEAASFGGVSRSYLWDT
uniref:V-type proton ATPase subunit a n=1 Tax=Vitis vinifera TaxID=29760 RepID=F6I763_VITVI